MVALRAVPRTVSLVAQLVRDGDAKDSAQSAPVLTCALKAPLGSETRILGHIMYSHLTVTVDGNKALESATTGSGSEAKGGSGGHGEAKAAGVARRLAATALAPLAVLPAAHGAGIGQVGRHHKFPSARIFVFPAVRSSLGADRCGRRGVRGGWLRSVICARPREALHKVSLRSSLLPSCPVRSCVRGRCACSLALAAMAPCSACVS